MTILLQGAGIQATTSTLADPIGDTLRADAVAYWKLDEASGDRADATGRDNTAYDRYHVQSAIGKIGNAAKFTNADLSRLQCAHNSAISIADEDFSIAFWLKQTTSSQAVIMSKEDDTGSEYTLQCWSGATLIYVASDDWDNYFEADANLSDSHGLGEWDFIVACYDSINHVLKISCNGTAFVTADTTGFAHAANTVPLTAGKDAYLSPELDLDEVGIWKGRVLSDSDMALLYNSGAGLAYPFTGQAGLLTSLSAYWSMDEANGTRHDSIGSNDFTERSPAGNTPGKIGNALLLDGSTQELIAPITSDLTVNGVDFYLSGWLKMTTVGTVQVVLSRKDNTGNLVYELAIQSSGIPQFLVQAGSPVAAATFGAMSAGTWYFIECYYDSNNALKGIAVNDGTFDTANVPTPVADAGGGLVEFGALDGSVGQILGGALDQWILLKRLPTQDERDYLYNSGTGRALFP